MLPAKQSAPSTVSSPLKTGSYCIPRTNALAVAIAFTHVLLEPLNIRKLAILALEVRWISVLSAPVVQRIQNTSMGKTVSLKGSCHCARKCVQPKLYWPEMATRSRISIAKEPSLVDSVLELGDGVQLTIPKIPKSCGYTGHLLWQSCVSP